MMRLPNFANPHSPVGVLLTGLTFLTLGTAIVRGENDGDGKVSGPALVDPPQPEIPTAPPPGTDVVPHLHAPIVPGRNVIYSAGFQLVWNAMWDRFTKEAPKLDPVSDLAPLLNLRGIEEGDLSPGSVSVNCGYVHEGVVERIQREMAERFPGSRFRLEGPTPDEGGPPRIVVHAHLEKTLAFEKPFVPVSRADFHFVPENWSAARIDTTAIRGFGFEAVEHPASSQVEILHFSRPAAGDWSRNRFVIELKTRSADTELLLARLPPGPTVQATIEEVARLRREMPVDREKAQKEMKRLNSLPKEAYERIPYRELQQVQQGIFDSNPKIVSSYDTLTVPVIDFKLCREYSELAGRKVVNHRGEAGAATITRASQTLRFRLDEKGLKLEDDSEGEEEEENGVAGRHLDFTRPFLLLLNERKSGKTVFAAWIGNAELLEAAPEPEPAPTPLGGEASDNDDPFAEP
jgi:hypothetical protein